MHTTASGMMCHSVVYVPHQRTAPIRTRPLGTNRSSDKYIVPRMVESVFRDLALFIAHTGFTNIRRVPIGSTDPSVFPTFKSYQTLELFNYRYCQSSQTQDCVTYQHCLLTCPSLEVAWRLVDQGLLNRSNELWYIVATSSFVLVVREPLSVGTRQLFEETTDEDLGAYDVLFSPPTIATSVDAFIERVLYIW